VPDRDAFCARLTDAGVGWDIHYRAALHQQPAHQERFRDAEVPACDERQGQIVSLPMINGLEEAEVAHVVDRVTDALDAVTRSAR
jgi:dTDP-4-amino-4,6-dideoxygalactose transaminase